MEEVVARKSYSAIVIYLIIGIVALSVCVAGVLIAATATDGDDIGTALELVIGGAIVFIAALVFFFRQLFKRNKLIVYKGGKLIFPDGTTFYPKTVDNVEKVNTGLAVTSGNEKVTVDGISNVEKSYIRLCEIIRQAKAAIKAESVSKPAPATEPTPVQMEKVVEALKQVAQAKAETAAEPETQKSVEAETKPDEYKFEEDPLYQKFKIH